MSITYCIYMQAFNFSFELSTSQTPVKATPLWDINVSSCLGGFGTVVDSGYGVSYIIVGEDDGKNITVDLNLVIFFLCLQLTSAYTASVVVLRLILGSLEMLFLKVLKT